MAFRTHIAANFDANGSPLEEGDMVRVGGDALCSLCDRPYRKHPLTYEHLDWNGEPFLHVDCSGRLLKL